MFENSPKECKTADLADIYLHHGKAAFDTGIDLRLLQEYYVVALDVFRKSKYSKDINELNAWLSLLTATTIDDLAALISDYPWMETICMDMSEYLYHPEEVVTMFSEALRKLDENTVNYMIDELKKNVMKQSPLWPKEMLQYLRWVLLYLKRTPRLPYYKLSLQH